MIARKLTENISAVCPIHGISFGILNDKNTWKIDFKDGATAQQRTDAQNALQAFDPASENQLYEDRKAALDAEAVSDNFIELLRSATPNQIRTFVANNVTDLASAKQLLGRLAVAVAFTLRGGTDK